MSTQEKRQLSDEDVTRYSGRRLREIRLDCKMTQPALAKRLGITFQQVQKYEQGTNRISAARLYRLSKIFGVPASTFLPGDETDERPLSEDESRHLENYRDVTAEQKRSLLNISDAVKAANNS